MNIFDIVIWGGALLTLLGLIGIVWCIWTVWMARRSGLDEVQFRTRMQRVVAINMAALGASVIGLMAVVIGIMLAN
jgi:hypothetical protein